MNQQPPRSTWSIQDAEAHFGDVVDAATKTPQTVVKDGEDAVVIVSAEEYRRLKSTDPKEEAPAKDKAAPAAENPQPAEKMTLADWLLAIPKAPDDEEEDEDIFKRVRVKCRDIQF
jgi:prevent-host-death family protein